MINSLGSGGAENHVVRVGGELRKRGWEVSIFCLLRRGELIDRAESVGIRVFGPSHDIPSRAWVPRAAVALYCYLRHARPDVVATYLTASDTVGAVTARLARVPIVVTSRRYFHGYSGLKLGTYRLAVLLSDVCSDRIIAVSDASSRQAVGEGTPASKLVTIHNSVLMPEDSGRKRGSPTEEIVIGTVGRLHPDKGYASLIAALPKVVGRFPTARLVVVGDGSERTALERDAMAFGVSDRISFLGQRADVPDLLQSFDLFVLPSLREGMPNALLEAMASGLPVIASGVGGILEIVHDGDNGLLVPPGRPELLAAAIIRLCSDPDLREQLAQTGRRSISENFGDLQIEVNSMGAVYRELLGRLDAG